MIAIDAVTARGSLSRDIVGWWSKDQWSCISCQYTSVQAVHQASTSADGGFKGVLNMSSDLWIDCKTKVAATDPITGSLLADSTGSTRPPVSSRGLAESEGQFMEDGSEISISNSGGDCSCVERMFEPSSRSVEPVPSKLHSTAR